MRQIGKLSSSPQLNVRPDLLKASYVRVAPQLSAKYALIVAKEQAALRRYSVEREARMRQSLEALGVSPDKLVAELKDALAPRDEKERDARLVVLGKRYNELFVQAKKRAGITDLAGELSHELALDKNFRVQNEPGGGVDIQNPEPAPTPEPQAQPSSVQQTLHAPYTLDGFTGSPMDEFMLGNWGRRSDGVFRADATTLIVGSVQGTAYIGQEIKVPARARRVRVELNLALEMRSVAIVAFGYASSEVLLVTRLTNAAGTVLAEKRTSYLHSVAPFLANVQKDQSRSVRQVLSYEFPAAQGPEPLLLTVQGECWAGCGGIPGAAIARLTGKLRLIDVQFSLT
jgi:hypothetical protein